MRLQVPQRAHHGHPALEERRRPPDLRLYARMNDPERAEWVLKSMSQNVDSIITAHLPHSTPTRGLRRSSRPWAILRRPAAQEAERTGELCEVSNE
jgi:hypothetical protein